MLSEPWQSNAWNPSRREALRFLVLGGLSVAAGGCVPVRLALKAYPAEFDHDQSLTDRTLMAFVHAVVPGLPAGPHPAIRVFEDSFYQVAPYRAFLASELDRRAESDFGRSFRALKPTERHAVIHDALRGDTITRRLCTAAIFLTQLAVYGGIHDDRAGSPIIDFPGGYQAPVPTSLSHPDLERFRARSVSADGNPS